eukprot:scaffold179335_cov20-Tisochrysis_lutea.AAC.1
MHMLLTAAAVQNLPVGQKISRASEAQQPGRRSTHALAAPAPSSRSMRKRPQNQAAKRRQEDPRMNRTYPKTLYPIPQPKRETLGSLSPQKPPFSPVSPAEAREQASRPHDQVGTAHVYSNNPPALIPQFAHVLWVLVEEFDVSCNVSLFPISLAPRKHAS